MDERYERIKEWDTYSKFHVEHHVNYVVSLLKNKKDLVIVDVGANSGTYFDLLKEKVDIKRAILFEPQPELYNYLKSKYAGDDRIIVENIALCDSVRKYKLEDYDFNRHVNSVQEDEFNLGLSKIIYDENGEQETNFFDNIRDRYNLNKIDFLKIDTETEDILVLKGFTDTLNSLLQKPIIEFECNWFTKYKLEESEDILNTFCKETGYVNNVDLKKRGDYYLIPIKKSNTTIVTGLWDLGRGTIDGWSKRDFQNYKNNFFELLKCDAQMCIWIPKSLEDEVIEIRKGKPTKIYYKELNDFKTWFPYFDKLQEIRTNPSWYNTAGWLPESPQAALEFYNPMMMCKMFMVNDSAILNPFDTEYFYWIDGGITSTVHSGYFTHHNVFDKLEDYSKQIDKLTFITYPYIPSNEIHGFEKNKFLEYCGIDSEEIYISRGGFWGGSKNKIHKINGLYYEILTSTINAGYMGADECLFTILTYNYPDLIEPFRIEGNGLIWPFFEHMRNFVYDENQIKKEVALYVLGFNFPKQFETLCISIEKYDPDLLSKTKKFLLNNSTDRSTDEEYHRICQKYDFEEIKKDNIGICGGRQFISEHSDKNNFDYHMFFEDDMFFYLGQDDVCRNGFRRKIPNFFNTIMSIMKKEKFDFLKWNFSEFFGDNSRQWAWYNIPQNVREELFPEQPNKTENDFGKEPFLKFKNIKSLDGLPYATGDIFYCNWPQIVSKIGNKKMFVDVKWNHPFEQTWMSYIYQETVKNNIKPGLLLATPTEHNRFDYYTREERREN